MTKVNGVNPWKDLVSDREKELAGVRHDVPHVPGWWLQLARLSPWNARYHQAQARIAAASKFKGVFDRVIVNGETPTDADELLLHELEVRAFIEGCVRGGEFEDKDGEKKDASNVHDVLDLFLKMPALYHWARQQAEAASNFIPVEDVEKNSGAVSGS